MEYTLDIRDQEIFLIIGTVKNPELVRNDIEAAIISVKDFSRICVYCAVTSFADDRLVEKCRKWSEGNIAMYVDHLTMWIVGRCKDELKTLQNKLTEERFVREDDFLDLTETLFSTEG